MTEGRLGLALVGRPQMGGWLQRLAQGRYVAGCDIREECCAEARAALGVRTFTDYRQVLGLPEVDVVIIRTPNHLHARMTIEALDAGKHVFCEKPMALTLDDCRAMVQAARRNRRRLQINLELRSSVLPRRMKEIAASGELGEVRRVIFSHYQGAWDHEPGHWRMDLERSGGIFPEKLVHEVDVFRWIAGEIEWVQCFAAANVIPQSAYPDCLQAVYWFRNGAMGSMLHTQTRSAMNVPPERYHEFGHDLWFDVIGTAGSLRADAWTGVLDVYHLEPGAHAGHLLSNFARREDYGGLGMTRAAHDSGAHLAEFLRRILTGEEEYHPPEDVVKTMAATLAAERAVRSGRRERVEGV